MAQAEHQAAQYGADIFLAGDGVEDVSNLKLCCDDNVNILILTAFRH